MRVAICNGICCQLRPNTIVLTSLFCNTSAAAAGRKPWRRGRAWHGRQRPVWHQPWQRLCRRWLCQPAPPAAAPGRQQAGQRWQRGSAAAGAWRSAAADARPRRHAGAAGRGAPPPTPAPTVRPLGGPPAAALLPAAPRGNAAPAAPLLHAAVWSRCALRAWWRGLSDPWSACMLPPC